MSNKTNKYYTDLDARNYLPTFKRYPIVLEKGEGEYVWDVEGNKYLDMLAGIAVNSVGHCHPHVVMAIREQATRLLHISNLYTSRPQVELSQKLTTISGMDHVFLANSGAEAVEGAIKIARKYAHSKGRGGTIISFTGSFHGRTLATIATGKAKMQHGFEPIPHGFVKAEFNDIDSVKAVMDEQTAAVIIEPVQGEGGINVADLDFLLALRELCDQHDVLLIFDEIQCGMGRTGKMFAKDLFGVQPDIMTLAKALGGGAPIGAILSTTRAGSAIEFGDHGTTFGGNPLVCSAALAAIEVIENENLPERARTRGKLLKEKIAGLGFEGITDIRGPGLMIGVELDFDAKPVVGELLDRHVLSNATAGNVLRLVPPLNIREDSIEMFIEKLEASLKEVAAHA